MASSDDDEDIKRAIALSLQGDSVAGQKSQDVINLDSDDEETAVTSIRSKPNTTPVMDPLPVVSNSQVNGGASLPAVAAPGILGLDRKRMEEERLARKRKTSVSPPPSRKVPKTSANESGTSTLADGQDSGNSGNGATIPGHMSIGSGTSTLQYPQGVVKKTWAYGHPRRNDDIKLEEILQQNDLNLAVMSSFIWDIEWLLAKINTQGD